MSATRELLLLRHAQSGPSSPTGRDYDRILTDFGRRQVDPVGRTLVASGFKPQLVLCSASARTRETLALLDDSGLCSGAEVMYSEKLYECTTQQILLQLAAVDDAIERVLLVGHNPGLSDLATMLSHQSVGLSPGDYVGLLFQGDWPAIDAQKSQLKAY